MVSADNKHWKIFFRKSCDKRVEYLHRLRRWDLLIVNIPREDHTIRLLVFCQIQDPFKNIFLILDHRKFINSLSDMKIR